MSSLLAGAARASISPRGEDLREGVYLGGFGAYRQRRATGVRDDVQCRALALSDGTSGFVLAALDLVGASGPLLETIRRDAARLTNLPPERVLIACTHSHASPDTQGLWGGVPAAYETHIAHRAASAVWEAWDGLRPARGYAATASCEGRVRNRRGWPETDTALTSLRFSGADGSAIATLVNYACHPTAGGAANTEVSRDWCGYTVDAIERESGGVAVYVNGAIGDVIPAKDGFAAAQDLGEAVAAQALASLDTADEIALAIRVRDAAVALPMNLERLSARVQDAVARGGFALSALGRAGGLRAAAAALHTAGRADLAQLVAALETMSERQIIRDEGGAFIPTHCAHVTIGETVEALAAPGEVLTRLALPLRAAMGAPHRLFLGLTHDTLGYFVPEDEWMTGRNEDYEESVSLGKRAGLALADALLSLVPHHSEGAV